MGGGSSDAGTVLKFLDETFPGCPREELIAMAKSIGADVPFFLAPQDAAVRGIGEKITPIGTLPMPFILVVSPNFPVRAAWAYKHLSCLTPPEKAEEELILLTEALKKENFPEAAHLCANDLEQPLFDKFPLLRHLRQLLTEKGALCVHVSGSGPLLYAFFESQNAMQSAAALLQSAEYQDSGIKAIMC
jgi:4-diphosphocytidyl-2-C-methyl-D-erythritol kinase